MSAFWGICENLWEFAGFYGLFRFFQLPYNDEILGVCGEFFVDSSPCCRKAQNDEMVGNFMNFLWIASRFFEKLLAMTN